MSDKVKGKINQAKGAVKTKIGNLTDNNKLKAEGVADKATGKAQEVKGNVKESVKDTKRKLTK